ncbi:MAG: DMT family transporter [Actinomycetota bacterium]|nr:DMT family transporter [Actinomycetota bacterium]
MTGASVDAQPRSRREARVAAYLSLGVLAASFSPILLRLADDAEPLALSFWRCAAGAAILFPFARSRLRSIGRVEFKTCAVSGLFLALHFATWITSLELTTVASSVLLVSTTPIFVALVAPFVVKENLKPTGWAGVGAAFAGTALITGVDFGGASLDGNLLALTGGATAAGYVLAGRLARRSLDILSYAVVTYGVAAVILGIVCVIGRVPVGGYGAGTWWAIVGVIVGPQLLGHTIINLVLSDIDVTTVSVSLMAEPVVATILAAFIFDEIPSLVLYPGAAAIFVGIYLVAASQRAARVPPPT